MPTPPHSTPATEFSQPTQPHNKTRPNPATPQSTAPQPHRWSTHQQNLRDIIESEATQKKRPRLESAQAQLAEANKQICGMLQVVESGSFALGSGGADAAAGSHASGQQPKQQAQQQLAQEQHQQQEQQEQQQEEEEQEEKEEQEQQPLAEMYARQGYLRLPTYIT